MSNWKSNTTLNSNTMVNSQANPCEAQTAPLAHHRHHHLQCDHPPLFSSRLIPATKLSSSLTDFTQFKTISTTATSIYSQTLFSFSYATRSTSSHFSLLPCLSFTVASLTNNPKRLNILEDFENFEHFEHFGYISKILIDIWAEIRLSIRHPKKIIFWAKYRRNYWFFSHWLELRKRLNPQLNVLTS